ncbi:MAG TPA: squalene/phytoene synthase family protein, partial [Promineifilum sp.]|nr:squalene/phytoene synthase family protein [Promineifilum sp.]
MAVQLDLWEHSLLAQAYAPLENRLRHGAELVAGSAQSRRAYDHCRAITRQHSRTFFIASSLMRAEHRRAIQALYAFCRVSDDIVDRNDGDRPADLRA